MAANNNRPSSLAIFTNRQIYVGILIGRSFLLGVPAYGSVAKAQATDKMQQKVSLVMHNQSILEAVVALGINAQLPMGITLTRPQELCNGQETRSFTNVSRAELLSLLLAKTPPFSLHNVSVEQIANFIVSLGSKGVWTLTSNAPEEPANRKITDLRLNTYGYKDDVNALKSNLCSK